MVCVYCGQKTHVTNSRLQRRSNQVWRRRECLSCHALFTTNEAVDYAATWTVRGASGRPQPFMRDKLLLSLYKSLEHRSDALVAAGDLADTVIRKLSSSITQGSVASGAITTTVTVALNRFDKPASVHYQAFHTSS